MHLPFPIAVANYQPVKGSPFSVLVYTTPRSRNQGQDSYGVYKRWAATFKIDAALWAVAAAPGLFPKMRDTLEVAGITWRVNRDVDSPRVPGNLFRLNCVHLEIDPALADTISIVLPLDSTDQYASPLTTAGASRVFTARIQFLREATEDFQGIQFMRPWYRIFVAGLNENLPLGTTVLATAGEYLGTVFRVVSNDFIDSLDELETLTVTVDP